MKSAELDFKGVYLCTTEIQLRSVARTALSRPGYCGNSEDVSQDLLYLNQDGDSLIEGPLQHWTASLPGPDTVLPESPGSERIFLWSVVFLCSVKS